MYNTKNEARSLRLQWRSAKTHSALGLTFGKLEIDRDRSKSCKIYEINTEKSYLVKASTAMHEDLTSIDNIEFSF